MGIGRGQQTPIGGEGHRVNAPGMSLEGGFLAARLRVPEPYRVIGAACRYEMAARRKSYRGYPVRMSFERGDCGSFAPVPEPRHRILARACQKPPVGRESRGQHGAVESSVQGGKELTAASIPDAHFAAAAAFAARRCQNERITEFRQRDTVNRQGCRYFGVVQDAYTGCLGNGPDFHGIIRACHGQRITIRSERQGRDGASLVAAEH